jgi:3-deoxy-D-manno-octulosonic-acid transferase
MSPRPSDAAPPAGATLSERAYGVLATVGASLAGLGARVSGTSQADLAARRGELPQAPPPLLWLHGASAGEVAAAANLVALLRGAGSSFTAGLTTANEAGANWLRRNAPQDAAVAMAPWDAPARVERAFDRWRPSAVFLVETEIWPWLILAAARRGVPVFSVSARIYPRDVSRYRWARPFLAPTFGRLTAVLAQSETERQRFVDLGALPERCFVAGNLKHLSPADSGGQGGAQRREHGLVVCGSIHRDEMAGLFTALESVAHLASRFVVAPRHAGGAAAAMQEAERRGWPVAKRSIGPHDGGCRVLLLDTMGDLAGFYARAEIAIVGGGFARHGGHNLYEPLRMGVPVLFGPHFEHFESEARSLVALARESQVNGWPELADRLRRTLADEDGRRDLFARQVRALPDPSAIGKRYLEVLAPWLDKRD